MRAPKKQSQPAFHRHHLSFRPTVELLEPRLLLSGLEETYSYWGVAYPDGVSDQTQLVNIASTTGQVTWVGSPMSNPNQIHGLVVTNDGQFFGVNSSPDDRGFYSVNRDSGQATLIGRTDYWLAGGLAYDPNTDTIYGLGKLTADAAEMQLAICDRTTGDVSLVGTGSTALSDTIGLAWNAGNQELLAFDQSLDTFFRVTTAGEISALGHVPQLPAVTGGLAHDGQGAALPLHNPYHNQLLGFFDPVTGQRTNDMLLMSEPVGFHALEYALLPASTPGLGGQAQHAYIGIAHPDIPDGRNQLMIIDPETGHISWLGSPLSATDRLDGLVVTNDGELYGVNGPTGDFYSVDWETGDATLVGNSGYVVAWGLGYDPATDTIYGLGRPTSADSANTLLIYDRNSGAGTPVGPGADDVTGTSGIAWDAANNRLIVFDTSDEEFYSFDTAGNATLLSTVSQAIVAFGVAHNGQHVVMPLGRIPYKDPNKNLYFGYFDPDTGQRTNDTLRLSQPITFNALDYGLLPASTPGSNGQQQYAYIGIGWSPSPYHGYQLLSVEPTTGHVTWHGNGLADPNYLHAMIVTNAGALYGIVGDTGDFYSVDWETGQAALIGNSGFDLAYGMAYDPATDTIYGLGKASPADTVNRLLIYDRNTGVATAVGSGIEGLTGTSGLSWDAANNRVIAFDNGDDEFYSFDTAGNATRLSVAEDPINTWGIAYREDSLVMPLGVTLAFDRLLGFYDPTTGQPADEMLRFSQPMDFEALEYLDNARPLISIVDVVPEGMSSRTILFDAYDSDSNAHVSLYYDDDNQGLDGQLIVQGLPENDGPDGYLWDATGVDDGEYHIYAVIDDGLNLPQYAYSMTSVQHANTGIKGRVFRDYNANGVWDGDEPAVARHGIYLDLNDNGTYDPNEPITTSARDDQTTQINEAGQYRFVGLEPGDYRVRQLLPSILAQTYPENEAGHLVTVEDGNLESGMDFGNRSRLQNPLNRFDVNADTVVSPKDALWVIAWLNTGDFQLPTSGPDYLDVNGDIEVSPIDVLLVIDRLNRADGEGESLRQETSSHIPSAVNIDFAVSQSNHATTVPALDSQPYRTARHADQLLAPQNLFNGVPHLDAETSDELDASRSARDILLTWHETDWASNSGLDEDLCELLSIASAGGP